MSKSAVAKAPTVVYFGPSDTLYCRVGSIDANETVEVHAKELGYYYITYTAGSTKKRGYVPEGSFVNESGLPTSAMFNSGCLGVCTVEAGSPVYYGPASSGFALAGTVSYSETFTVFLPAVNNWYYIEYPTSSGAKRGFIPVASVRNLKGVLVRMNDEIVVYSGPKTSYATLGGLSQHEYCVLIGSGVVDTTRLHAFRHTKGVELINNGMSLVHVQKWMAHMSPEMTLVYAKVLDTTLRKSWEQAVKNGLFKITSSGQLKQIDISGIENEDLIEWEYIRYNLDAVRMPLGFCMKPKKQDCFTQLNPCLTCRNLCTTPDFLPQYEHEIQETKLLIERGKAQGREVWVEKNQHLLERYEEIVSILRSGQTRHLAGKKGREYIGEERKNVN